MQTVPYRMLPTVIFLASTSLLPCTSHDNRRKVSLPDRQVAVDDAERPKVALCHSGGMAVKFSMSSMQTFDVVWLHRVVLLFVFIEPPKTAKH